MLTNISETLDYIYSFANLEAGLKKSVVSKNYNLDNIKNILNALGNPHKSLKYIHIAGTKGKGSTTLFVTRLLIESGYNTLSFLSPHLIDTNERILFNMIPIRDDSFIEITSDIKKILDNEKLTPTTFELFFIIAILYGLRKDADYFVIETGLGGRLDCTNVIKPEVSIITSIGYDHTEILGNTIKKIAMEKAGIIKDRVPVVLSKQFYRCTKIFKKIADDKMAPFYDTAKLYKTGNYLYHKKGLSFSFKRKEHSKIRFDLPVMGKHQINNFITAIEAVRLISPDIIEHFAIDPLFDLSIPGRIELIDGKRNIIADVSHTAESSKELVYTLKKHFPKTKWTVLIGLSLDKDYEKITSQIIKIADKIIVTQLSSYKKSDSEKVCNHILKSGFKNCSVINEQKAAFYEVMKSKSNILVTGSFYLAGPFIDYYRSSEKL